mmetsp:Transcript_56939/g.161656  ORF Transcript_56939/g.161656 Transcript_56939/m.161656 type:complete len:189 (+) Transcript_56939:41-607(+)
MPGRDARTPGTPSRGLSRTASAPGPPGSADAADVPVKQMNLHRRAAEIVALSYLCAPSSTGTLQHQQLRRVRRALEDADEQLICGSRSSTTPGPERDRQWTRQQMAQRKARRGEPAAEEGPTWRLRRGTWFYEGPAAKPISADEALQEFREEEERRGRGPAYRNGVAAPGYMRRFHARNPIGGFYDVL